MRFVKNRGLLSCALLGLLTGGTVLATVPPRPGVSWPTGFQQYAQRSRTALQRSRSFAPLMQRINANRAAVGAGTMTMAVAMGMGGTAVTGSKSIPVLTARFSNTAANPFPVADLQTELFDGPWPSGTMTDFYEEISYGQFTVDGTVADWQTLPQADTFYESGCNGIFCSGTTSNFGDYLTDSLDLHDTGIDFSQYDNDGPDGVPNSGDDDGFVDFVAFVHPEAGGECGNANIWSHRFLYSGWFGGVYTTNDARSGGGQIQIDDYVIMPGLACDGTTMIQIGVFAHEFGHAFGLPDLYDTDDSNGNSEGIGNWGLMAGGSWGGDGVSPQTPTHMSVWAKEFMGWVTPTVVTANMTPASLDNIEDNAFALRIPISPTQYYLISNRQMTKFDANLPASGLLIWRINETVVNSGLMNNTVNGDEANKGVDLEEADGQADLDAENNRADDGDAFPGSTNKTSFDNGTNPGSTGSISVCDIGVPADPATANVFINNGSCGAGGGGGGSGGGTCTSLVIPVSGGNGPGPLGGWLAVFLPPLLAAAALLWSGRRRREAAV